MRIGLRLGWAALVAAGLHSAGAAAGTFDARGVYSADPDVVFTESFEDPNTLDGRVRLFDRNYSPLPSTAVDLSQYIYTDEPQILDGTGLFRVTRNGFGGGGPVYVTVDLPVLDGRVELRMWSRAESLSTGFSAVYARSKDPNELAFATVAAVQTGRRTSDNWVEYATGPLDTHVMGVPLQRVLLGGSFGGITVDALEVKRLGDRLIPDNQACTLFNMDTTCGAVGECILGQCVDSAAVWGAVPYTTVHKTEYLDRYAHIFTRVHANRRAVSTRGTTFVHTLEALRETTSPRLFFGGLASAVNRFRDGHTSGPMGYGSFYSSLNSSLGAQNSGALGACLGLTELDVRGGGWGYTVFRTDGVGGAIQADLRVGDILVEVDGRSLEQWLAAGAGAWGLNPPSDPASDPAYLALDLPGLLSTRATTLVFERCASAVDCSAPTRITVPVAQPLRTATLMEGHIQRVIEPFACDGRFSNSVPTIAPDPEDGGDAVSYAQVGEVMTLQFNGVSGEDAWDQAVGAALANTPQYVLVDTRLGNGGYLQRVQFLVGQLRDQSSPRVGLGVARPWHALDPEGFFDQFYPCLDGASEDPLGLDACAVSLGLETPVTTAPAGGAKVAWLHTADISGNDYAPIMLQGRGNFRIFGPHATAGAFGAVAGLAPLLPNDYSGGSVQIHDTRFANSRAALSTTPYQSGVGVPPDEVCLQKLSDSLNATDTMLARARAWLLEMP